MVAANRHEREREIAHAERIVGEEVARMTGWLAGREVVPTIARLRGTVDGIREAELARLGGRLAALSPEQRDEVEQLTAAIVNKILHAPTVRMKELAAEPDAYVYVDALRRLFDLDDAPPKSAGERVEPAVSLPGGDERDKALGPEGERSVRAASGRRATGR